MNLQKEIFNLVQKIPKGEVLTYKQIAIKLNKPKSSCKNSF